MTEDRKTHSEKAMGLIDFVLEQAETAPGDLGAIAVTTGPGSFTGLRIGLGIAKAMGQALGIPVIGIDTLDALCYPAISHRLRCALMDARRNEVYSVCYRGDDVVVPHAARPLGALLEAVQSLDEQTLFIGDGVRVYREEILRKLKNLAVFAPEPFAVQTAAAVLALAWSAGTTGLSDAYTVLPRYYRLSQAEREAAIQHGAQQ